LPFRRPPPSCRGPRMASFFPTIGLFQDLFASQQANNGAFFLSSRAFSLLFGVSLFSFVCVVYHPLPSHRSYVRSTMALLSCVVSVSAACSILNSFKPIFYEYRIGSPLPRCVFLPTLSPRWANTRTFFWTFYCPRLWNSVLTFSTSFEGHFYESVGKTPPRLLDGSAHISPSLPHRFRSSLGRTSIFFGMQGLSDLLSTF